MGQREIIWALKGDDGQRFKQCWLKKYKNPRNKIKNAKNGDEKDAGSGVRCADKMTQVYKKFLTFSPPNQVR